MSSINIQSNQYKDISNTINCIGGDLQHLGAVDSLSYISLAPCDVTKKTTSCLACDQSISDIRCLSRAPGCSRHIDLRPPAHSRVRDRHKSLSLPMTNFKQSALSQFWKKWKNITILKARERKTAQTRRKSLGIERLAISTLHRVRNHRVSTIMEYLLWGVTFVNTAFYCTYI